MLQLRRELALARKKLEEIGRQGTAMGPEKYVPEREGLMVVSPDSSGTRGSQHEEKSDNVSGRRHGVEFVCVGTMLVPSLLCSGCGFILSISCILSVLKCTLLGGRPAKSLLCVARGVVRLFPGLL